jgi:hypothetical protein
MATSAERMRALRERQRCGVRRLTIEVSEDDLRAIAKRRYTVTLHPKNGAGRGGDARRGPTGTWVSTQRPLPTASPSRNIRFSSQPLDFAWNFLPRPIRRACAGRSRLPLASFAHCPPGGASEALPSSAGLASPTLRERTERAESGKKRQPRSKSTCSHRRCRSPAAGPVKRRSRSAAAADGAIFSRALGLRHVLGVDLGFIHCRGDGGRSRLAKEAEGSRKQRARAA